MPVDVHTRQTGDFLITTKGETLKTANMERVTTRLFRGRSLRAPTVATNEYSNAC